MSATTFRLKLDHRIAQSRTNDERHRQDLFAQRTQHERPNKRVELGNFKTAPLAIGAEWRCMFMFCS
jgi:hypothetical protein